MSDLIERASLTEGDIEAIIARLDVDQWGKRFLWPQHSTPIDRAIADVQLAKALWTVVEWQEELRHEGWTAEGVLLALRGALEAAGIERPRVEAKP